MANMSYCQFENTFLALKDCYRALEEKGVEGVKADASVWERISVGNVINLCKEIAEYFGEANEEEVCDEL